MSSFGYISSIALFIYIFLSLILLAARRNKIVNSFLIILISMICWTGGSLLMRSEFWPNYRFWYHVSLLGLFLLPYSYYRFITEFAGRRKGFTNCVYLIISTILFVVNLSSGFLLDAPEIIDEGGRHSFVYHYTWGIILLFIPGVAAVAHIVSTLVKFSRTNRKMAKQFEPICAGVFVLAAGHILLLLPVFGGFPIDILSGVINAIFIVYALIKRRLFKLKLLASESVCYGVGVLLNFVLYFNITPYISEFLQELFADAVQYYSLIYAMCFITTTTLTIGIWRVLIKNVFIRDEIQQAEYLNNFSSAVSKSLCVKDILNEIINVVKKTTDAEGIYICIQDTKTGDYKAEYSDRPLSDLSFVLKADNPLVSWLNSHEEGILMNDLKNTVMYKSMWEQEKRQLADMRIEACIGLKVDEQLVGILLLAEKRGKKKFDYGHLQLMNSIASVASIAIKNARLYEIAYYEARTDELTGLLNRKYFQEVLEKEFRENIDGSLALVIINVDDFKLYNQLYGNKQADMALKRIAEILKANIGDNGYVARYTGKEFALLLPKYDVYAAKNLTESIRNQIYYMNHECRDYKLKAITVSAGISVAPYAAKTVRELLENVDLAVYHVKRNGKNGIKVFDTLLQEKTVAVQDGSEKAHIYEEYESMIYALTAAIDAKDHYTFQHSKNVAYYATELAKVLNLNSDIIEILNQAALLHDVGKVGIPEAVLNKPGRLTDEEYEIIKGHVEASIGIIRHLPSLDYVIPAVLAHHERYDGKGYPRRIAGEDIPMSARILCIADSFDAMTSVRCYKKAIPIDRVLEILKEEEGRQFDPYMARVFADCIRSGKIKVVKPENELPA